MRTRYKPSGYHLPDCASVRDYRYECNCGQPPFPIPAGKALVKRWNPELGRLQIQMVNQRDLEPGEEDLNETRLGMSNAEAYRFADMGQDAL